jgi:hypothetical protein
VRAAQDLGLQALPVELRARDQAELDRAEAQLGAAIGRDYSQLRDHTQRAATGREPLPTQDRGRPARSSSALSGAPRVERSTEVPTRPSKRSTAGVAERTGRQRDRSQRR